MDDTSNQDNCKKSKTKHSVIQFVKKTKQTKQNKKQTNKQTNEQTNKQF